MIHPDEGRLRALLDDEIEGPLARSVREHVAGCPRCAAAFRVVEEAGRRCTALLLAADVPAPTARVRARLAERRAAGSADGAPAAIPIGRPRRGPARSRAWIGRSDLARAALLLLGFSGAVAAAVHPASPVRRWISGDEAAAPAAAVPTSRSAPARAEVGVRLAVAAAGVRIVVEGAPAGTPIEVRWVEDGPAAVYAPEGSSFSTSEADGRIGARVTGGPIRIEIPRAAARASLSVGGLRYLEKVGERVDYPGPTATVAGPVIRFRVQ